MSIEDSIERMNNLESKFLRLYKIIEFNQSEFYRDDELGAVHFDENGEYVIGEPFKYARIAGFIPLESHREIIKIITEYLDEGWGMPIEMRTYLSARFKESISSKPKNLDSLFGLREKERNREGDKNKENAVYYIQFRRALHKEIALKNSGNAYLSIKSLNNDLCDELNSLFLKGVVSVDKVKDLTREGKLIGLNDEVRLYYCEKDIECLVKCRDYLNETIPKVDVNKTEKLQVMRLTLKTICQKLKKYSIVKTGL
ncbi:hypothetical protein DQ158_08355 [Escherichia coli]|nr:hypothetical protein [Escherichia coli]